MKDLDDRGFRTGYEYMRNLSSTLFQIYDETMNDDSEATSDPIKSEESQDANVVKIVEIITANGTTENPQDPDMIVNEQNEEDHIRSMINSSSSIEVNFILKKFYFFKLIFLN